MNGLIFFVFAAAGLWVITVAISLAANGRIASSIATGLSGALLIVAPFIITYGVS